MHNALHLNQGNGFFSDISQLAGVSKTEWSWSSLLSDFDNDGNRDMFVANGYRRDLFDGDIAKNKRLIYRLICIKFQSPQEMLEKGFKGFINIYDPIKVRITYSGIKVIFSLKMYLKRWGFNDSSFSNGAAIGGS